MTLVIAVLIGLTIPLSSVPVAATAGPSRLQSADSPASCAHTPTATFDLDDPFVEDADDDVEPDGAQPVALTCARHQPTEPIQQLAIIAREPRDASYPCGCVCVQTARGPPG